MIKKKKYAISCDVDFNELNDEEVMLTFEFILLPEALKYIPDIIQHLYGYVAAILKNGINKFDYE